MINLIIVLSVAVLCLTSFIRSYFSWRRMDFVNRNFDYCVNDIRTMNTYNSYFLAAIMIFIGFAIDKGTDVLPASALVIFLLAFIFAAFAIFFFPLKRSKDGMTPESMRRLWLLTLVSSQWVVILSAGGIANAVLSKLF